MLEDWDLLEALLPSLTLKIGVAVLCGLVLGAEREWKGKPAGLRTLVLITVGSTLFMIVSQLMTHVAEGPSSVMRIDPSRIAAGVVSGIGFLGAGTIVQARGAVHGLTTAAVIWVAAGIGLCIGAGFPLLALGAAVITTAVLVLMRPLRGWLSRRRTPQTLTFLAPDDSLRLQRVRQVLSRGDVREEDLSMHAAGEGEVRIEAAHYARGSSEGQLLAALSRIEGVRGMPELGERRGEP